MNKNLRELAKRTHDKSLLVETVEEEVLVYATATEIFAFIDGGIREILTEPIAGLHGVCYCDGELYFGGLNGFYSVNKRERPTLIANIIVDNLASNGNFVYRSREKKLFLARPQHDIIDEFPSGITALCAFDNCLAYVHEDSETHNHALKIADMADGQIINETEALQSIDPIDSLCMTQDGFFFASSFRNYIEKTGETIFRSNTGNIAALASANNILYAVCGADLWDITNNKQLANVIYPVEDMCAVPKKFIEEGWNYE